MDWSPLGNPSLMTRVAIAKGIGLIFGLLAFFMGPVMYPGMDLYTRIGILLWYPTMGAFIGLFGVMNWHPILHIRLPWWFRSIFVGAWLNFLLVFFAHEQMSEVLLGLTETPMSPFWFTAVGGLIGGLMGYVATKYGGDGPETTTVLQH